MKSHLSIKQNRLPERVSQLAMLISLAFTLPSLAQTDMPSNAGYMPSFKSGLQHYNVQLEGLVMLDMTKANGVYADGEPLSEVGVRRARLGLGGDISKRLSAEFSVDLEVDDSTASVHEAALDYDWTKQQSVKAGLFKQPFGLEGSTSSRHLRTLERSMASEAFVPDRSIGAAWSHDSSSHYLSLGVFRDLDVQEVQYVTARASWSPIQSKRKVLHAGVNISQRENAGTEYRIRNSGNIASGENFLKSGRFNPDSITTLGVEGAWSYGSLLIQAEWFLQSLSLPVVEGSSEPRFSGGYIQAGWVFNQGYRKYDGRRFGKIAGTDNRRELELVASVGTVDVRHAGKGDQASEVTLGLNYQMSKHLSLGSQVQSVNALDNNESLKSGEGVQLRLIATF